MFAIPEEMSMVSDVELKSPVDLTKTNTIITIGRIPTIVSERQLREDWRTYKNVLVICLAFLLQFTAFSAIANLQSSLNNEANGGVNSLSIIYGCLLLSATFLPHSFIATFGLKWTMVISQIPYVFIWNKDDLTFIP